MNYIIKILKRHKWRRLLLELFLLIINYPLYCISFLLPRQKDKWIFGNKVSFSDNAKYLYLYLLEHTEKNVLWIASNRKTVRDMRNKGLPVFFKYSLQGLYHSLTAKYYVCTVATNQINFWTSAGAYKINLWHGVGLKSYIDDNTSLKDKSFLSKIIMPYSCEKYDLFLSTSDLMTKHFSKSLSISEKNIFEGLYPRCCFLRQDKNYILKFIKRYEQDQILEMIEDFEKYNRIYIYMPTWRLSYGCRFLDYAFDDIALLNETLKNRNSLLLLKLHPAMHYDLYRNKYLHNIMYLDPYMDVYPLLPFTDVLITDYSSIYYDYLLMNNKECILYDFDYNFYVSNEFKFILDYKEYTPGVHVNCFKDLILLLRDNIPCHVEDSEWILNLFWGDYTAHDMEFLFNKIDSIK